MKKRYEKNKLIFIVSIFFVSMIMLFFIFLFKIKLVVYKNISGVVFSDNIVTFLVDDEDLKLFYKNKIICFENEKKKFDLKKIDKNILERDGVKYHYVYLEVIIPKSYKVNDIFNISVMEKNIRCIEMFRIIWEG